MLQNIDRLKVFYHIFAGGSVLSASKALNVSQSAISQSLQKLERELSTHLFTRMHKRLVPTAAGNNLYAVVRPFMAELDSCLNHIQQSREKPFGELRIGAPVEFGRAYLPGVMAEFRKLHPDVTFYMKLGDAATLLPLVEKGRIDFALVDVFLTQRQFFANPDIFHFSPIVEEEVILACSDRYYNKVIKNDHSYENLIKQDFISYRPNAQTVKNWFRHHFGKSSGNHRIVLTVDNQQAIISAIRHHAGIGVIASYLAGEELRQGDIVPIDTSKPKIINQISLALLQDKVPTLAEKVFRNFLLEKSQSIKL